MSVSSMANLAYARRDDVEPKGKGIEGAEGVAAETGQKPGTGGAASSTVAAMAAYIPTEIVTVYVAVVAALGAPVDATATTSGSIDVGPAAGSTSLAMYLVFIALTPVIVWAAYARTAMAAEHPLPRSIGAWPKWEMLAATIAFAIWAAALPSSPLARYPWFSAALAGVVALVVSMMIGAFAPIFSQRSLAAS